MITKPLIYNIKNMKYTLFLNFGSIATGCLPKNGVLKLCFILILGFSTSSLAITRNEAIEHVNESIGRTLAPNQLKKTNAALSPLFERLASAQAAIIEGIDSSSELVFIDSKQVNAFVITAKENGISQARNIVFLTTGILEYYLKSGLKPGESPSQGLMELIGIMAHELQHPVDKLDMTGIENHYGKTANQGIEIRADTGAIQLLRAAGFPVDALFLALQRLFSRFGSHQQHALASGLSTHPAEQVRLGAQRIALWWDRFQSGASNPDLKIEESIDDILREVANRPEEKPLKVAFVPPSSIDEALDRFQKIPSAQPLNNKKMLKLITATKGPRRVKEHSKFQILEETNRNALLIYIDQQLASCADAAQCRENIKRLSEIYPNEPIEMSKQNHPIEMLEDASWITQRFTHHKYLETLPQYNDPQLAAELGSKMYQALMSDLGEHAIKANLYSYKMMNFEDHLKSFSFAKYANALSSGMFLSILEQTLNKIGSLSTPETLAQFYNTFSRTSMMDSWPELTRERVKLYLVKRSLLSQVGNLSQPTGAVLNLDLLKQFTDLESKWNSYKLFAKHKPDSVEFRLTQEWENIAHELWARRGQLAAIELVTSGHQTETHVPWNFILKTLSIPEKLGYQQIAAAFGHVLKNPEQNKWLHLQIESLLKESNSDTSEEKINKKMAWMNRHVLMQILAHNQQQENDTRSKSLKTVVQRNALKFFPNEMKSQYDSKVPDLLKSHNGPVTIEDLVKMDDVILERLFGKLELKNPAAESDTREKIINLLNIELTNPPLHGAAVGFDGQNSASMSSGEKDSFGEIEKSPLEIHRNRTQRIFRIIQSLPTTTSEEAKNKTDLLTELLNNHEINRLEADLTDFYLELRKFSVVKSLSEFTKKFGKVEKKALHSRLFPMVFPNQQKSVDETFVSLFFTNVRDDLVREIDALANETKTPAEKIRKLLEYSKTLAVQRDQITYRQDLTNSFIKSAAALPMTITDKYKFFINLTNLSADTHTDRYFTQTILPYISQNKEWNALARTLEKDRLYSDELKTTLARTVLASEAIHVRENPTSNKLYDFTTRLKNLVSNDSSARDQLLEEYAWQFHLEGIKLKANIVDNKSLNWRKTDPRWVNAASAVSELINDLNLTQKFDFLKYIIYAKPGDSLPKNLEKVLFDITKKAITSTQELTSHRSTLKQNHTPADLDALASKKAYQARLTIEKLVHSTKPVERVPVIDIILSTGSPSMVNRPSTLNYLQEHWIGLKQGSVELEMLNAFLEVIPKHEQSISLAYILANRDAGQSKLNNGTAALLEIFSTVGIKFGQMAATWNLFGDDTTEQIKKLYDRATPMTLDEVQDALKKYLPDEEYRRIAKFEKILGGASIKTVVQVKLTNGQTVALMVQRPSAQAQVKENMRLALKFLEALERRSVNVTHPMFKPLIESLKHQLLPELDFRNEVKNYALLGKIFEKRSFQHKGWKLEIPQVRSEIEAKEKVFLTDAIIGENSGDIRSLKDVMEDKTISNQFKAEIGELVTSSSLELLFKHGLFDPDRHVGNFLVDINNKKVVFIDPGQLVDFRASQKSWQWDPRLTLAEFMNAFNTKNARNLVHYAGIMANGHNLDKATQQELTQKIAQVMNSALNLQDRLTEIITLLYGAKFQFDHIFTFGGLKGLMTLFAPDFVSETRFKELIEHHAKSLYKTKLPAVVLERAKTAKEKLIQRTQQLFSQEPKSGPNLYCKKFYGAK
ncbi:MAG: hypothetical protein JNL11_19795 [Bdellovibrionaceae bacterium]|nr:hypothetical protein [Pseudobdellovibrionaceae bacterium]